MSISIEGPLLGQSAACEAVLRALPEWFGIEAAVAQYVRDVAELPTFVAREGDAAVGILAVKRHYPHAAEIYVMGVLSSYHRRGIGRALLARAEEMLREAGVEYLQVKTLGPSHSDPGYAGTRAFYQAVGFRPLEELTRIWDESNPCLILVKRLGCGAGRI